MLEGTFFIEGAIRMKIYINGKYYSKEDACISVYDHGLLYGDGVFEGMRVYNGKIFKLQEHIDRLYQSAHTLMMSIPLSREEMCRANNDTVAENTFTDGYIRLIVTRGVGSLGLNPFICKEPQIIIIYDKIQLYPDEFYENGLKIVTVPTLRIHDGFVPARVKSLNYLNNIMGKIEAINAGVIEALMLNDQGFVSECTGDNVFIIQDKVLHTPPVQSGILEGITRNVIFDIAGALGYEVRTTEMTRYDLFNADECFLTGTAAGVIPVISVDGRIVGDGTPGAITRELISKYNDLTLA